MIFLSFLSFVPGCLDSLGDQVDPRDAYEVMGPEMRWTARAGAIEKNLPCLLSDCMYLRIFFRLFFFFFFPSPTLFLCFGFWFLGNILPPPCV